jgi:hypothetical protein
VPRLASLTSAVHLPHVAGPHPMTRAGPMGHEEQASCPIQTISRAAGVSRLVHEARDLNLPVEPGVREGRNALVPWAVLLAEVLP